MTNSPGGPQEPPNDPSLGPPGYWAQHAGQQDQPAPYGYPPVPPMQYPPDHPRATTSLVLGILGIVACQVLAPFAWVIGKRTVAEIDAARGMVGGRSAAQAGYVMGVVGTALLGLSLLLFAVWLAILAVLALAPAP